MKHTFIFTHTENGQLLQDQIAYIFDLKKKRFCQLISLIYMQTDKTICRESITVFKNKARLSSENEGIFYKAVMRPSFSNKSKLNAVEEVYEGES